MRWEDERYVRVYTRNTPEWLALSWRARGIFCLVLRAVDRAGLLPVGKLGLRGVAVVVGAPPEDADGALRELLADGCLRFDEVAGLVMVPNFLAAQEAVQSDAARKRASRERARATAMSQNVTVGHADPADGGNVPAAARVGNMGADAHMSRDVTLGHESGQLVTNQGQNVTRGHAVTRAVTPILTVPSLTEEEIAPPGAPGPDGPGLFPGMESDPIDMVREVYDHWLAGWKRVIGGTNPPKLTDQRRRKVKARLAEGHTVEEIKRATDALWTDSWHIENGYYDLELVCRDSVKLSSFLARIEKPKPPPPVEPPKGPPQSAPRRREHDPEVSPEERAKGLEIARLHIERMKNGGLAHRPLTEEQLREKQKGDVARLVATMTPEEKADYERGPDRMEAQ
jgi:hypothetical protein